MKKRDDDSGNINKANITPTDAVVFGIAALVSFVGRAL